MGIVAVSAGESASSKTRALASAALDMAGGDTRLVDLSTLSADGLLGRTQDDVVADAVAAAGQADRLVLASPVYRATYSAPLKAFLDRFPTGGLARTAVVLVATAGIAEHFLSLDTGMRAAVASLGGWSVPTVVYATPADFTDGNVPTERITGVLRQALDEAEAMAAAIAAR